MSDNVWLHQVASWDKDIPGPKGVLHVSEHPIDADLDYEVPATSEQVVRWHAAERAYLAAQAEMQALYDNAVAVANAAEAAVLEAEDATWEEGQIIDQAVAGIAEAEADLEHGPRAWVIVERNREKGRGALVLTGRTIHHIDCPILAKTRAEVESRLASPTRIGSPMRHADAVAAVRDAADWTIRLVPCKRCAGLLTEVTGVDSVPPGVTFGKAVHQSSAQDPLPRHAINKRTVKLKGESVGTLYGMGSPEGGYYKAQSFKFVGSDGWEGTWFMLEDARKGIDTHYAQQAGVS